MLKPYKDGFALDVYLQPKASKDEIIGPYQEALKIKLKAPPVEGKANKALVSFLAKRLSLPKNHLKIISGLTSRRKRIYIEGLTKEEISKRLGIS
ncbi:DUF167 domain-containing protein [Thermodesulfatator atlanticus]